MKLASKINPKNLFRSKKSPSVSRSDPSSFNSYTTSSASPDNNNNINNNIITNKNDTKNKKSKGGNGNVTPTSVLQLSTHTHETTSSDEWSEASADIHYELIQAFKFIDCDGDGKITRDELETVLYGIGGTSSENHIREELTMMVNEIDKNGDGVITLEEFGAISSVFGPPACDTELRDVFEFFDTDGDGRVTADELLKVFRSLGDEKCTIDECTRMISGVDKNEDGFVCFEDFSRMMEPQQI